jgi:hypothetical protein
VCYKLNCLLGDWTDELGVYASLIAYQHVL